MGGQGDWDVLEDSVENYTIIHDFTRVVRIFEWRNEAVPDPLRWDRDLVMDLVTVSVKTKAEEPRFPFLEGIRCKVLWFRPAEAWDLWDVQDMILNTSWAYFPHLRRVTVVDVVLPKRGDEGRGRHKERGGSTRGSCREVDFAALERLHIRFANTVGEREARVGFERWRVGLEERGMWTETVRAEWKRVVRFSDPER